MELKVRLLEITPEVKNFKTLSSDILSLNFIYQNITVKMENIEKFIQTKEFIIIPLKNTFEKIKYTLLLNNISIIGVGQFFPCSETKFYRVIDINKNKEKIIKIKLETILPNKKHNTRSCNTPLKGSSKKTRTLAINKKNTAFKNISNYASTPLYKSPKFSRIINVKKFQNLNNDYDTDNGSVSLVMELSKINTNPNTMKKNTPKTNNLFPGNKNFTTLYNFNNLNDSFKLKNNKLNTHSAKINSLISRIEPNSINKNDFYKISTKKIEESIIDQNFKNLLMGDEILKDNKPPNQRRSSKLVNNRTYTNENTFPYDLNKNQFNGSFHSSDVSDTFSKNFESYNKPQPIQIDNMYKILNFDGDDDISQYENAKEDFLLFYTNEYLNTVNEEMILLEVQLMIDKILELQILYQKNFHNVAKNYKNYKNILKSFQKRYFLLNKKVQKIENEKLRALFKKKLNDNFYLTNNINKNNEIKLWNNMLNNKTTNLKKDKNEVRGIFLNICGKNLDNLNALSKKYYLDAKKKYEIEQNNSKKVKNERGKDPKVNKEYANQINNAKLKNKGLGTKTKNNSKSRMNNIPNKKKVNNKFNI